MKKIICLLFALLSILQSIAQNYNYDNVYHDYNAYNPNCEYKDVFSSNTSLYSEIEDELFANPMAIILLGTWETSKATIPSCIYVGSVDKIYRTYRIQAKNDLNVEDRSDNRLTTLNIGAGVHEIGKNAFRGFTSLETVTFEENGTLLKGGCVESLRCNYQFASKEISCQLEKIEDYAFADCNNLKAVTLPSSIKYIGECAFDISNEEHDNHTLTIKCNALKAPEIWENTFSEWVKENATLIVPQCATGYQEWGFTNIQGGVPISADDFNNLNYTKTYDGKPDLDLGKTSFTKDAYTINIKDATILQINNYEVLEPCGDATNEYSPVYTKIEFSVSGNGCNIDDEIMIPKGTINPLAIDLKQILEDHVFAKKLYDGNTDVKYQEGIPLEDDREISGITINYELQETGDRLQFVFYSPSPTYDRRDIGKRTITIQGGINIDKIEIGSEIGKRQNYSITNDFSENGQLSVDGWIYPSIEDIKFEQICDNNTAKISFSYGKTNSNVETDNTVFYGKIAVEDFNQTVKIKGGTIEFLLPDNISPGKHEGSLVLTDSNGNDTISEVKPFEMDLLVSRDVIKQLYQNVIFVDNSSDYYTGYKWYKIVDNDTITLNNATLQYYHPGADIELNGKYFVDLETENGIYRSCPTKPFNPITKRAITITPYPNPAKEGQPFTLKINDADLENAYILIFNNTGAQIKRIDNIQPYTTIALPKGYYSGALVVDGEKTGFKIIVE